MGCPQPLTNKPGLWDLLDALCFVFDQQDLQPKRDERGNIIETYCNFAVDRVCQRIGYAKLQHKTANEIVDYMRTHPEEWEGVNLPQAQDLANDGNLVVVGTTGDPHGHVACVRPGRAAFSQNWNCLCPQLMNVGASNSIGKAANWIFKTSQPPPEAYRLI